MLLVLFVFSLLPLLILSPLPLSQKLLSPLLLSPLSLFTLSQGCCHLCCCCCGHGSSVAAATIATDAVMLPFDIACCRYRTLHHCCCRRRFRCGRYRKHAATAAIAGAVITGAAIAISAATIAVVQFLQQKQKEAFVRIVTNANSKQTIHSLNDNVKQGSTYQRYYHQCCVAVAVDVVIMDWHNDMRMDGGS